MTTDLTTLGPLDPLLDTETLLAATLGQLSTTIEVLRGEQIRRALEESDPVAVAEDAFTDSGFDGRGNPAAPYLHRGLLVCPGMKAEKSKTSHDCVFVSLDDSWAWEHPDAIFDEMRQLPGTKVVRRSVTIFAAYEGMTYDVVTSTARGGGRCQMANVRSFEVRGDSVVETRARTRAAAGHR